MPESLLTLRSRVDVGVLYNGSSSRDIYYQNLSHNDRCTQKLRNVSDKSIAEVKVKIAG